jgi:hypothetical protein
VFFYNGSCFGGKSDFHIDHFPGSFQGALFVVAAHRDILAVAGWIGYLKAETGTQVLLGLDGNIPATVAILHDCFHGFPPIISGFFSVSLTINNKTDYCSWEAGGCQGAYLSPGRHEAWRLYDILYMLEPLLD